MLPAKPTDLLRAAALAAVRLGASALVHAGGLRALSDDDYARAVIAEQVAGSPRLDPSGTSWLPFPFWIEGATMAAFGPSLVTARVTSAVVAALSVGLLYLGLRAFGMSPRRATQAGLFASLFPPAYVLGALAVPELPTACLVSLALVLVATGDPSKLVLAGAALLPATLSRYEAWPVAFAVAAMTLADRRAPARARGLAAALSLAGPAAWMAWNLASHGDALHFLSRVSAYSAALGLRGHALTSAAQYLMALLFGALSITLPFVVAVVLAARRAPEALARWKRPALGALALFAFLLAGAVLGGAPTHHPERALLTIWVLGAASAIDLAGAALERSGPRPRWALVAWAAGAVVYAAACVHDLTQTTRDRSIRADQEAIGLALRELVPKGERVLVATEDYGYFAVVAAFGRPADVVVDRSHDPRKDTEPSALESPEALAKKLDAERARFIVIEGGRPAVAGFRERARAGALRALSRD